MASSVIAGHKLSGLDIIKPYPTSQALSWNPISKFSISNCKHEFSLWGNLSRVLNYDVKTKRNSFAVNASGHGAPDDHPSPSRKPPSDSMRSWILGMAVSLILPSFTQKLGPVWVLKNRIDNSVQMVEDITEAVEKVAEDLDKIAEEIGETLPEGKLKKIVSSVEDIAEKTAKTADSLDDIIDKVQEMEEEVESVIQSIIARDAKKPRKEAKDAENHDH